MAVATIASCIPENRYYDLWRTPKFFTPESLLLAAASALVFLFGWLLGDRLGAGRETGSVAEWDRHIAWNALMNLFRLSFCLCLTGYVVWTASAVSHGAGLSTLLVVFRGGMPVTQFRAAYLGNLVGLTSLTQFGMSTVVLGCVIGCGRGWRIVRKQCALVFALAAFRAYLNSERLAMIELLVPFIVLYVHLTFARKGTGAGARKIVRFGPAFGAVALFGIFTLFEYFRSWLLFYSSRQSSLLEFSSLRLLGYYVTAANNGAYLLRCLGHPIGSPYFTLNFLWTFPFVGDLAKSILPQPAFTSTDKLLAAGANVEFNSVDGFFNPFMDFGWPGALLYWLVIGLICGIVYRAFLRKSPLGLFLYPTIYLGLLEMPRYIYWAQGRAFVSLFLLLLATEICNTSKPARLFEAAS